jgi:hypothetical protein
MNFEGMWIRGSLGLILGTSAILIEGTRKAARNFNEDLRFAEPRKVLSLQIWWQCVTL